MNSQAFDWNTSRQLSLPMLLVAVFVPSAIGFAGFHGVLPKMVASGMPAIIAWPVVATVMLAGFSILAVYLLRREARELGISFSARACLTRVPLKRWLIYLALTVASLVVVAGVTPLLVEFLVAINFKVPSYMPFFLDPSIDPMTAPPEVVSPGLDLKGQFIYLPLLGVTLFFNIMVEEFYFRAWMMPKLTRYGGWSWVMNGTLFALYHTFQLWLFPVLLIASLTFAFVVYHSKSVWPSIVFHLFTNLLVLLGVFALMAGMAPQG